MKRIAIWLPIGLFSGLLVLFVFGLQNDPKRIPSVLIGKEAPKFALNTLDKDGSINELKISSTSLKGQVWLLNVFASWCVTCQIEHKHLMKIAKINPDLMLVGLAYKDDPTATADWLEKFGNPYSMVLIDREGLTGIDWGVYGVPETFVINNAGAIVYKNIGAIDENFYKNETEPLLKKQTKKNKQ